MSDSAIVELGIDGLTNAVHIGAGGAADVYRAEQASLGRTVAVKVLRSSTAEKDRARFERETQTLGRLSSHPGIVTLFQAGTTIRGQSYLMMEYCPKGTLADRITTTGTVPWPDACTIVGHLAAVVSEAHEAGVLHRDLKPANVLIDHRGHPLIADFGVAALSTTGDFSAATDFTPGYAPPEALLGEPAAPAGDVYSLGAIAHALITGRVPFEAREGASDSVLAWIRRIEHDQPEDLRPLGVADEAAELIEKAMAKSPAERPDIDSFAEAMTAVGGSPVTPADPSASPCSGLETAGTGVTDSAQADPATAAIGDLVPRLPDTGELPDVAASALSGPPTPTEADASTRALDEVLPSAPTTLDRTDHEVARPRRGPFIAVGVLLLAAVVAGGLFAVSRGGDPRASATTTVTDTTRPTSAVTTATSKPATSTSTTESGLLSALAVSAEATMDVADDRVVLAGAVHSRLVAQEIVAAAAQVYGEAVDDQLEVDSTASTTELVLEGSISSSEALDALIEELEAIGSLALTASVEIVAAPTTVATSPPATSRPTTTRAPVTAAPTTVATTTPATTAAPTTAPTMPPTTAAPSTASPETSSALG